MSRFVFICNVSQARFLFFAPIGYIDLYNVTMSFIGKLSRADVRGEGGFPVFDRLADIVLLFKSNYLSFSICFSIIRFSSDFSILFTSLIYTLLTMM